MANKLQKVLYQVSMLMPAFALAVVPKLFSKTDSIFGWVVFSCSTLIVIIFVVSFHYIKKKQSLMKIEIKAINKLSGEYMKIFVTYIIPIVTLNIENVNWYIMTIIAVLYIFIVCKCDVSPVNPLLLVVGYRYYSIELPNGTLYKMISKRSIREPDDIGNVKEIYDSLLVEEE